MTVLDEGRAPGHRNVDQLQPRRRGPPEHGGQCHLGRALGIGVVRHRAGRHPLSATGWDTFEEAAGAHVTQRGAAGRPISGLAPTAMGCCTTRSNRWEAFTAADGLPSDRVLSVWGSGSNDGLGGHRPGRSPLQRSPVGDRHAGRGPGRPGGAGHLGRWQEHLLVRHGSRPEPLRRR